MKVIFLGYVVPPAEEGLTSGLSVAGNRMQWNVIQGLAQIDNVEVECISVVPSVVFPKNKMIFHKKEKRRYARHISCTRISYINIPIVKQVSQIIGVYRAGKKAIKNSPDSVLLTFNLFPQVGIPFRMLKKRFPQNRMVTLLADLPLDDDTNRKGISRWLRGIFDRSTIKSIEACEHFVVLNQGAAKTYLTDKQDYIVVDGGVDETQIKSSVTTQHCIRKEKNILFCGALTEYNGVKALIEAMKYIEDSDIYLDIYGGGYLENFVKEASNQNSKIRFHGSVRHEVILQRQREAWILINPRIVSDPIAKVTFPSKTFEYMLSRTPILSTRLNGYSSEYQDKINWIDDDSPKGIAHAIQVMNGMKAETLRCMADRAYDFVVSERTWSRQCKKINLFLKQERIEIDETDKNNK